MTRGMERFLDYVLRHLIESPEEMVIIKDETEKRTVFRLRLRESDIPRVVGRGGATILAIRNLLDAAAAKHGRRAGVEIIEREYREQRMATPAVAEPLPSPEVPPQLED